MDEGEQSCLSGRVQRQTVLMIGRFPRDKMSIVYMSGCQWIEMHRVKTNSNENIGHTVQVTTFPKVWKS